MKATKMIIAAVVALSCSLSASGQKKEKEVTKNETKEAVAPKPPHNHGGMNLSEDQKKKMKDIRIRTQKDVLPLKNQLAEKKAHLRTLTTVDKPDMNEINRTIDEMSAIKTQIAKKKIAAKMEVRSLLNDEQRLKFDTRPGKHSRKMKRMHHGHKDNQNEKHREHHED